MIAKLYYSNFLKCSRTDDTSISHDSECNLLKLTVGTIGGQERESFDVTVCTPDWLARHVAKNGPELGRYHLIVEYMSTKVARAFTSERIKRQQADDWPTLVNRLSRMGRPSSAHELSGKTAAVVKSAFLIEGERLDRGAFWLRLLVGPHGGRGEESFDVCVCTTDWLKGQVSSQGPMFGRHHLIVNRLNIDQATDFLRNVIENKRAQTWTELATELGEIGAWEFEDYD